MASKTLSIDRALTLWASVVAGRLGFERDEALTLGRAVAGGLIFATTATLLFVPVIFSMMHRSHVAKNTASSESSHAN